MWEALITHARTPDDLLRVSKQAGSNLLYNYAERLHLAAIERGATRSPRELKEIVFKRRQLGELRDIVTAGTPSKYRTDHAHLDHVFYQLVINKLDRVPASCRAAFVLRYIESLSLTEIAATLGIEERTASRRSARAMAVLRTELLAEKMG
ncbi:hypothetical protein ILP97_00775 [Amycolatopsis sp. H6(2020)]|nr:hypothetical protein [Amycolatopsis sp. H6(2020)]